MTKKSQLILQHILDCGVLESSNTDEVLTIFDSDVASTVAVSIVSSFTNKGSSPHITSEFSIDWVMQVVAYALSLPTLYNEALTEALTIFRHWLTCDTFFKDSKTRNAYARQIFRYLSQIFEYKHDNAHPAPRRELISTLMHDIDSYQNDLREVFEDETWDVLVRILIGACDFLATPESISAISDTARNVLLNKCFTLLFKVLINSKLQGQEIWAVFYKFTIKWSALDDFLSSWHDCILDLWKRLLDSLYSPKLEIRTDVDAKSLTLLGFQLHRFINCIDFELISSTQEIFKNFSRTVQDLVDVCTMHPKSSPELLQPLFPAKIFFNLFGRWCFKCFDPKFTAGQSVIIKGLMTIAGEWDLYTLPDWSSLMISTISENISRGEHQLLKSVLNNGHYIFKRFVSPEIFQMLHSAIKQFDRTLQIWLAFCASYSVLLMDVAEAIPLDSAILNNFLQKNEVQWATLNIFSIFMNQSVEDFFECLKNTRFSPNVRKLNLWRNEEAATFFDVAASICYMIAAAAPFHCLESQIVDIVKLFLDLVKENMEDKNLLYAFLVMVSQSTKWFDSIFNSSISVDLLDFLDMINTSGLLETAKIEVISRMLCGRSLNRSFQSQKVNGICEYCTAAKGDNLSLLSQPEIATFMSGNSSLITIVGDKNRNDSFTAYVRDPRGFFVWEIADEFTDHNYKVDETNYTDIPDNYFTDVNHPTSNNKIDNKEIADVVSQLKDKTCFDKNFYERNFFRELNYIKSRRLNKNDNKDKLRHKAVDFIIGTGLYSNVSKIDQDIKEIISQFDAIPSASIINVPIFHVNKDGIKQGHNTPLLNRFVQLIGTPHEFLTKTLPAVQFGLATVAYDINEPQGAELCSIIFCESPLNLNVKHKSIPKTEMLITVKPIDERFYSCCGFTKDSKFWNPILEERVVSAENLSEVISSTVFMYAVAHRKDLIFEKDIARAALLKGIRTTPVDILSITETFSLKCFE